MKAREQALRVLIHMEEKGAYANLELKNALQLDDPREKAFATELVYGVLRYRLNLEVYPGPIFHRKTEKNCPSNPTDHPSGDLPADVPG